MFQATFCSQFRSYTAPLRDKNGARVIMLATAAAPPLFAVRHTALELSLRVGHGF